MFVRVEHSDQGDRTYESFQIVESLRETNHVRRWVLVALSYRDQFVLDGSLDDLLTL